TIVLHIEMNPEKSIGEAHQFISKFEAHLKQYNPIIKEIITHIEPYTESKDYPLTLEILRKQIQSLIQKESILKNCHDITIFPMGDKLYHLTFHCDADSSLSVREIHNATKRLEADIRENIPVFSQIVIHVEPSFTN
ncbi:MAG: cation transporter dimerization domain-containing protein, partial [Candidatus Hodarchaeota archaeon]